MSAQPGPFSQEPQLILFRRRLRDRMEDAGVDAGALAEACGQTPRCVWQWLSGVRIPTAPSLIRISRALGVPVDWLLGESPSECARRAIQARALEERKGPRSG